MADLAPVKERLAKCIRLFGSAERANARTMTERALESVGANWTDLGDWIEHSYNEQEMLEMAAAIRKDERARECRRATATSCCLRPSKMAEFCHERLVSIEGRQAARVCRRHVCDHAAGDEPIIEERLGYLVSIYIQIGGRI